MSKITFRPTFCVRDWDKVEMRGEATIHRSDRGSETFNVLYKDDKISFIPGENPKRTYKYIPAMTIQEEAKLRIMIQTYVDCFREEKEFSFTDFSLEVYQGRN